jgi:ribonuclease D
MKTLTTTKELADFCSDAAGHPYVTVDTNSCASGPIIPNSA